MECLGLERDLQIHLPVKVPWQTLCTQLLILITGIATSGFFSFFVLAARMDL